MKIIFPAGQTYIDASGNRYVSDANGMLDIGTADPIPFENAGFILLPDNAVPTGARPTLGVSPGLMLFDITIGKPIWRNSSNSGWVDWSGTAA